MFHSRVLSTVLCVSFDNNDNNAIYNALNSLKQQMRSQCWRETSLALFWKGPLRCLVSARQLADLGQLYKCRNFRVDFFRLVLAVFVCGVNWTAGPQRERRRTFVTVEKVF